MTEVVCPRRFSLSDSARWLERGDVRSLTIGRIVVLFFGVAMLSVALAAWSGVGFAAEARSQGPFYLLLVFGACLVSWQGAALMRGTKVGVALPVDESGLLF